MENPAVSMLRRSNMRARICGSLAIVLTLAACSDSGSDESIASTSSPASSSAEPTVDTDIAVPSSDTSGDTVHAIRVEPSTAAAGESIQVSGVVSALDDDLFIGGSAGLERLVGAAWIREWLLIENGVGLPPASLPSEVAIPSGANPFGTAQSFELPAGIQPGDYRVCVSLLPLQTDVCEPITIVA
jgi:hypothetical protein